MEFISTWVRNYRVSDELSWCFLSLRSLSIEWHRYKGYPGTDDYVVKVNKEARQAMVDKLLEDLASATSIYFRCSTNLHGLIGLQMLNRQALFLMWYSGPRPVHCGKVVCKAMHTGQYIRILSHPGYTWTPSRARRIQRSFGSHSYTLSPNAMVKKLPDNRENAETSDIIFRMDFRSDFRS